MLLWMEHICLRRDISIKRQNFSRFTLFYKRTCSNGIHSNDDKNEGITIPDIALLPGGVPIILKNGYHLGGVGVSGSSGTNDEKCAFEGN